MDVEFLFQHPCQFDPDLVDVCSPIIEDKVCCKDSLLRTEGPYMQIMNVSHVRLFSKDASDLLDIEAIRDTLHQHVACLLEQHPCAR